MFKPLINPRIPRIVTDQILLRQVSQPIVTVSQMETILNILYDNFVPSKMLGLAAIQLGIPLQPFVVFDRKENKLQPFINPRIVERHFPTTVEEGCLSIPELQFKVRRYKTIIMWTDGTYDDRGTAGGFHLTDEIARIAQHEYDHLQGKTLIQTGKIVNR